MRQFWDRTTLAELHRAWGEACPGGLWRRRKSRFIRAFFLFLGLALATALLGGLALVLCYPVLPIGTDMLPAAVVPGWIALVVWPAGLVWIRLLLGDLQAPTILLEWPVSASEVRGHVAWRTQMVMLRRLGVGFAFFLAVVVIITQATEPSAWSLPLVCKVLAGAGLLYGSTGFLASLPLGRYQRRWRLHGRMKIEDLPVVLWGLMIAAVWIHFQSGARWLFLAKAQPFWDWLPHTNLVAWLMGSELSWNGLFFHGMLGGVSFWLIFSHYRRHLAIGLGKLIGGCTDWDNDPQPLEPGEEDALADDEALSWFGSARDRSPRLGLEDELRQKLDAESSAQVELRCLLAPGNSYPGNLSSPVLLVLAGVLPALMAESLTRGWIGALFQCILHQVQLSGVGVWLEVLVMVLVWLPLGIACLWLCKVMYAAIERPSYQEYPQVDEALGAPSWKWLPLDLRKAEAAYRKWAAAWRNRGLVVHAWVWASFVAAGAGFQLLNHLLPNPVSLFAPHRFWKVIVIILIESAGYWLFWVLWMQIDVHALYKGSRRRLYQ